MSNELAKYLNSRRRFKDEIAIKKQTKIAKQRGSFTNEHDIVKQPHRLAKRHAMDCGRPACALCGNPRRIHKDKLTAQEKRLFQDVDSARSQCRNGIIPKED